MRLKKKVLDDNLMNDIWAENQGSQNSGQNIHKNTKNPHTQPATGNGDLGHNIKVKV